MVRLPDVLPVNALMALVTATLFFLLRRIERGELDTTRIITHTLPLDEAERCFELFKNKQDRCEEVVPKP